jgi:PH (Pleckstrin Homology) domain-containing protein
MKYKGVELHSNEEVKGTARQYPARLLIPLLLAANLVALAFFMLVPLWGLHLWHWDIHVLGQFIFFAAVGIGCIWALRAWVTHRGTMLIVTNQRVIQLDRRGLFDKNVSEIPYESLSDVSYRTKGIFEMMAGAGTISFQMLGGKGEYTFKHLLHPAAFHKKVMELRIAYAHGTPAVTDKVEDVMNTVATLSPTEKRAILANMKRVAPKPKKITTDFDAAG